MVWKVAFYTSAEDEILAMPPKIQARMIKLLELIELAHNRMKEVK